MYVYILSDYDEHGAENVAATLNRAALLSLVDKNWPNAATNPKWFTDGKKGLSKLLEKTDDELSQSSDGHNCHDGWGGMQLHVIELSD